MNWLDWLLGLILLISLARGIAKGLTGEVIGLISTLLGLVLGIWFYGTAGNIFEPYVSAKSIASFLGFLLVFFGVVIAGHIVAYFAGRVVKAAGLSFVNRLLGAAFGAVKGLVVATGIVLVLVAFAPGVKPGVAPTAVTDSAIAPYVLGASHVLTGLAPRDLKDQFASRYDLVRHAWESAIDTNKKK